MVSTTCTSDESCLSGDATRCEAGACVTPRCPSGTRYVPGGRYRRGCSAASEDCEASAQPAHEVTIRSGFCLAEYETSVAAYRSCLDQGGCPQPPAPETLASLRCSTDRATWTPDASGDETLPMSCLLWSEAAAYCASAGGRLPTEAEWERAARGRDDRPFPWGRAAAVTCDQGANFAGLGCGELPWPATSADRSGAMQRGPFGHFDLGGNLSEWVADFYDPAAYTACGMACTDPGGPAQGEVHVRRGGTFLSPLSELRSFAREFHRPQGPRSDLIGVRCAFSVAR
jgi:formylglycine-generating enzyme required for sulfatase activity